MRHTIPTLLTSLVLLACTSPALAQRRGGRETGSVKAPEGERYAWDPESTYIKHPPYFEGMSAQLPALEGVTGARVLALLAS